MNDDYVTENGINMHDLNVRCMIVGKTLPFICAANKIPNFEKLALF